MSNKFTPEDAEELTQILSERVRDPRKNLTFRNCTLSVDSWKNILMDLVDGQEVDAKTAKMAENAAQLVTLLVSSLDPNSNTELEVMSHDNGKAYMCVVNKPMGKFQRMMSRVEDTKPEMTPLFEIMDVVDRDYLIEQGKFNPIK